MEMTADKLSAYRWNMIELSSANVEPSRRDELLAYQQEIKAFMKSVPYKLREPIRLYYLRPIGEGELRPTWETVAEELGNGELGYNLKSRVNKFLHQSEKSEK
jgi:hypothetical protein